MYMNLASFVSKIEPNRAGSVGRVWEEKREGDIAAGNNVFPIFSQ